jgi:hypothetical protein
MADLVLASSNSITKVAKNQLGAAAVIGFTSYLTACILVDWDEEKDGSKQETLAELWSAAYVTWKWYMGLGPAPAINTGIPNEIPRRKELTSGR